MANNIITAAYSSSNITYTKPAYQYDYGMILKFSGIDLPQAYEVHFSNTEFCGESISQIGDESGVTIPDEMFLSGNPIYAWMFLHTGEDDGETVYKAVIGVNKRAQPSNLEPTPVQQDAITQAIAALNVAVEQTAQDVIDAGAAATAAETAQGLAEDARDAAVVAQGEAEDAQEAAETAQGKAEEAQQAAEAAAGSVLGLTADATVDSNVGTPSVEVEVTTESDHKNMSFAFRNLKGVQGDPGVPGVGISSVVLNSDYTLTITLTNGTSYTTSSIRGEVGATPNLTIGTVSTLPEGSQATATITGTDEDPVLNLGIPVGNTGDPGVSPTITVTEITGGHEVEVVDAEGTQTFNVMDGIDGQSGLITDYVAEEKTPYLFRPSANGLANVISEKDMIVGGTVAWNQYARTTKQESTTYGITTTIADGKLSITGTPSLSGGVWRLDSFNDPIPVGNKCLLIGRTEHFHFRPQGNTGISTKLNGYLFFTAGASTVKSIVIQMEGMDITQAVNESVYLQYFDLTQMFGSTIADYIYALETANAGDGIAWFRKYFPKDYYAYNAGQLMSVKTSEHKMTGFNQYNHADGTAKVLCGYQYQITGTYTALSLDGTSITPDANGKFTPSVNGTLTVTGGNGTDTCIHLFWDGERDGEYEAYEEHSYALDSDLELRGILKLDANHELYYDGDTYESDGTVTRKYGIVDLGTLTWSRNSTYSMFYAKIGSGQTGYLYQGVCSKYVYSTITSADKVWGNSAFIGSGINFWVKDSAYTDTPTFKTAMSGVYLVYELATSTTEEADPYTNPQIVDADGTEEYVDERTVPIPVGHDTYYQQAVDVPQLPTTDGSYRLALSKTGNTAVASWEYVAQAEMKAQANIPSGKYFSVVERLFVSTQAIAQGANIVVGTNCTETTLADALNSLNS